MGVGIVLSFKKVLVNAPVCLVSSFVEPNTREGPRKPERPDEPDPRHAPGNIWYFHLLTSLPTNSQRLMGAVTERRGLGLLALAQGDLFLLRQRKLDRREPGSFMGPVTKRLGLRTPTLTPVVGARIQREHRWLFGWQ